MLAGFVLYSRVILRRMRSDEQVMPFSILSVFLLPYLFLGSLEKMLLKRGRGAPCSCPAIGKLLRDIPSGTFLAGPGGDIMKNVSGDDLVQVFENDDLTALQAWRHKTTRRFLANMSAEFVNDLASWKSFITLTFRDDRPVDVALSLWNKLVRALNSAAFGPKYQQFVKHSYFSYVLGMEYQTRGVIHFHALVDRPIHYGLVHDLWNDWAGFSHIRQIHNDDEQRSSTFYICKYVLKGGEIIPFVARVKRYPKELPYWWREEEVKRLL
jgi:hypothetical protein